MDYFICFHQDYISFSSASGPRTFQAFPPESGPTYGARPQPQAAKNPKNPHGRRNVEEDLWSEPSKLHLCPYLSGSVQHNLAKSTQLEAPYGPKDSFWVGSWQRPPALSQCYTGRGCQVTAGIGSGSLMTLIRNKRWLTKKWMGRYLPARI